MDFKIGWPSDDDVEAVRKTMVDVEERINAQLPPMVSKVTLQSFRWGSKAPVIGLTEIENLDADGFKGTIKLFYDGDFGLSLSTRVQTNLAACEGTADGAYWHVPTLAAHRPAWMPLLVSVSRVAFDGLLKVCHTSTEGFSAQWTKDPIKCIAIDTSLSYIPNLKEFLQATVEGAVRDFLHDEVPKMLHDTTRPRKKKIASASVPGHQPISAPADAIKLEIVENGGH